MDLLGSPFRLAETYVYYDGPRTFVLQSIDMPELYYLINAVDEDEEEFRLIYLAVALGERRYNAIRSGVVPFRSAFVEAPIHALHRIEVSLQGEIEQITIAPLHAQSIPDAWLPDADARLSLPTPTAPVFQSEELVALSHSQRRSMFSLEIERPGQTTTEFPSRHAGELQIAIDKAFAALLREDIRDPDTIRGLQISTVGLRAASFVLVLAVESDGLFEPPTTRMVFEKLSAFVQAVSSDRPDTLLKNLKEHSPKSRNRLRDILHPLADVGSGLSITTAEVSAPTATTVSASSESIQNAVRLIDDADPEVDEILISRGVLSGLMLRTKRFEITDLTTGIGPYRGSMTDEATDEANGLKVGSHSFVSARIRKERPFLNEETEESGVKYILESITEYNSKAST